MDSLEIHCTAEANENYDSEGISVEKSEISSTLQTNNTSLADGEVQMASNFQSISAVTCESDMNLDPADGNVMVKVESEIEDIDINMPISKTTVNEITNQRTEIFDTNVEMPSSTGEGSEQDNSTNNASAAFMDGLATPLMPRLRVKSELFLQMSKDHENAAEDSSDKDAAIHQSLLHLPYSSNCSSNFVMDGIATPSISLSQNRIRVKTEFSHTVASVDQNKEESVQHPNNLFNTGDNTDISVEPGNISPSISEDESEGEPIPEDFFDDLLHDKVKERIRDAQFNELEEKYSDKLKELERLKEMEEKFKRRSRRKQKKSKKKSRKRSSTQNTEDRNVKEVDSNDLPNYPNNKRSRLTAFNDKLPSILKHGHGEDIDENLLAPDFNIKPEISTTNLESNTTDAVPFAGNVEDIEEFLTPKEKMEKAIKQAAEVLKQFKEVPSENSTFSSTFSFVSAVRKLPINQSYLQQRIYENRSPLHTVNNVSYNFNSHSTRFNMEEWGLAALSPNTTKIAKLVGCDAQMIYNKLKTIKIPPKLRKIKQEADNEEDKEEELMESTSSLYSNVMTQTDDIRDFGNLSKSKGYDVAIQVATNSYSIGCQTLETQSPTKNVHNDDEPPIMKIMRDLNENQLMAIHSFAEMIKETSPTGNAMEMYKIQTKMLDIYKLSQIPSALAVKEPAFVNNYTTMTRKSEEHPEQICIQSVRGADYRQFSKKDPRSNSVSYSQGISNGDCNPSSNYNPRHPVPYYSHGRSSAHVRFEQTLNSSSRSSSGNGRRQYNRNLSTLPSSTQEQTPSYINHMLPTTNKPYGRGSLRR